MTNKTDPRQLESYLEQKEAYAGGLEPDVERLVDSLQEWQHEAELQPRAGFVNELAQELYEQQRPATSTPGFWRLLSRRLLDGTYRLAGILLLVAVTLWFAWTLRSEEHYAPDIGTVPADTTIGKSSREVLFVVSPEPIIHALDSDTLTQVGSIHLDVTEGPVVGPDGNLYSIADFSNLVALDLATGLQRVITTVTDPLRSQTGIPAPLAITPNGQRIVVSHYWTPPEGGVAEEITEFWRTIVDVESGAQLATIPETHENVVTSDTAACLGAHMFPSPDNRKLYELCLWDQDPLLRTLDLQQGSIVNVVRDPALLEAYFGALSADGQRLYVLTRDGRVAIFSVPDLVLSETITLSAGGGPERIQDYGGRTVLSPDGSRLYLNDRGHPETLYAIDTMTWQTVAQARLAEAEPVYDLALSSDGKRLYMLSMHNSLQLSMWDAMMLSRQQVIDAPEPVHMPARLVPVHLSPVAFSRLLPGNATIPSLLDSSGSQVNLSLTDYPPRDTPYFIQENDFWLVHNLAGELFAFVPASPEYRVAVTVEECAYHWTDAVERFVDPCSGDEWELDGTLNLEHSTELWSNRDLDQYAITTEENTIAVHLDQVTRGTMRVE